MSKSLLGCSLNDLDISFLAPYDKKEMSKSLREHPNFNKKRV